jgi:hypothetical protein
MGNNTVKLMENNIVTRFFLPPRATMVKTTF